MKTKTIASTLGLLAAATLLVADGAHARRSGHDHHRAAANTGDFDYEGRCCWSAAAAAGVNAKAAARARYDAHESDFLHRCYQPQRIWNGVYYTWRLSSVC
jgi:hypothetical protein